MSNILPLFAAAPRLKIKVNGVDIAYAVGLNMNVSIDVVPVKILGQFEIASLEPSMYNPVTGTFRVIRLLNPATQTAMKTAAEGGRTSLLGATTVLNPSVTNTAASSSVLSQSFLHRHLDPTKVLISQTFDIELFLKIPKMTVNQSTNTVSAYTGDLEESFLKILDCRVVGMDGEIAPGRLLEEPLSFQGLLAINAGLGSIGAEGLDSIVKDGKN